MDIYIFPNPAYLINESSLNIKCLYNIAYLHWFILLKKKSWKKNTFIHKKRKNLIK